MTLSEFLTNYYRARALNMGQPRDVVAAFKAAAKDDPVLLDAARAEVERIAALGLGEDDLKRRDFASWVSRDGLVKALG